MPGVSGDMYAKLVAATLTGLGHDVVNIGLATTPTTEIAVTAEKADGGIILTASHNPKQWNALKLLNSRGEFLSAADGEQVLKLAAKEEFEYAEVDELGTVVEKDYTPYHIDQVLALKLVNRDAIAQADLKIVVDAVNSVGGVVIPALLRALGVKEIIELNCEPTGHFAHNPEPIPENLTQIAAKMKESRADLGIVVDPDVDRLALISENGEMFGEEYTLVAVADYVLKHTPGNTVSNLSSSRALKDVTEAYGQQYHAAAVGESECGCRDETNAFGDRWRREWWCDLPGKSLRAGCFGRSWIILVPLRCPEQEDDRIEKYLSAIFYLERIR